MNSYATKRYEGDDLDAARRFSVLSFSHIQAISGSQTSSEDRLALLKDVVKSSQSVRARAIGQAAARALSAYQVASDDEVLGAHIPPLLKLLEQYTCGIVDIEKALKKELKAQAVTNEPSEPIKPANDELNTRYEQAHQTLSELVGHAKTERDQAALGALLSLNPHQPDSTQNSKSSDSACKKPFLEKPLVKSSPGSVGTSESSKRMTFASILPDITNEVLRVARQCDKRISLSHANEDVSLYPALADIIKDVLIEICSQLIIHSVEEPKVRQARGDSQSAQIAITVRAIKKQVDILISCDGAHSPQLSAFDEVITELKSVNIPMMTGFSSGLVRVEIGPFPQNIGEQELLCGSPFDGRREARR